MLLKRLSLGALLLAALIIITGCATTTEDTSLQEVRRHAEMECRGMGYDPGTFDFNECVQKTIGDSIK